MNKTGIILKKRIGRIVLLLFLAGTLSVILPQNITVRAANTSGTFEERITQLKRKFPSGKYWNHKRGSKSNPDEYTSVPCNHHGNCSKNGRDYSGSCGCNSFNGCSIQCMGFAEKLGYDVYGTNPRTQWKKSYDLANVKAGDILRYGTHSIFITKVSGDTLTYADCNSDGHCVIRWNGTIKKSQIHNFVYIQHANNYSQVVQGSRISISKCKISGLKSSYAYTGKAITPKLTVKYGKKTLKKGTDYTIKLQNNVNTGKAVLKISGKGKYKGSLNKKFKIVPKKAVLQSITAAKTGKLKIKWYRDKKASGYEILLSTDKNFKCGKQKILANKNSITAKEVNNLKLKKRYYVKIRAYKIVDKKKCYGQYSVVKSAMCK